MRATTGSAAAEAAEQNAAQYQQPHRLPEGERTHTQHGWQNVIPEQHDQSAENEDGGSDHQWDEKEESASHIAVLLNVSQFIVQRFQSAAQVLHRVPLAGDQRFDVFTGAVGNLLKSLVFEFVPDKYISLIFR